jgi:electron transfer flavoprotein alpha subunit
MAQILTILWTANGRIHQAADELLGFACALSQESGASLSTVLLGAERELAEDCAGRTCGKVLFVDNPHLRTSQPDLCLSAAQQIVQQLDPDLVLFPSTPSEHEIAVRLAARLGAGLASDCISIEWSGDRFRMVRPVFGGKAQAEVEGTTRPVLATLHAGAAQENAEATPSAEVEPLPVAVDESSARSRSLGRLPQEAGEGPSLVDARVIVSGGRGIGGRDGFEQLQELARLLGGAVGSSRAAVDADWVPASTQVGQTGKSVAPDLYLAVGISGASQHVAGIARAKHVIAINSDPEAPILSGVAEIGVVADWKEVIPALIREMRQRLGDAG